MAHRDILNLDDGSEFHFYNVDQPVGPGSTNRPDDVMLVQFFLKRFYSMPDRIANAPAGDMQVDGRFGPVTQRWINDFQRRIFRKTQNCATDGRVDPAHGAVTPSGRYLYTIAHMNAQWKMDLDLLGTPEKFDHLDKEPTDVPPDLANAVGSDQPAAVGSE